MLSLQNNLKELPQAGVTSLLRSVGSAASVRGDIFNMGQEIWKPVKKLEGKYEISNIGRLRSVDRVQENSKGVKIRYKGKPITPSVIPSGYYQTCIKLNGKDKSWYPHVMVAEAFIPNPQKKPQVNHINGIKTDNRVENLEWVTRSENMLHAFNTGLLKPAVGINQSQTKLTEEQVKYIFNSEKGARELGREFNMSHSIICAIRLGKTWNHITGLTRFIPIRFR